MVVPCWRVSQCFPVAGFYVGSAVNRVKPSREVVPGGDFALSAAQRPSQLLARVPDWSAQDRVL